MNAKFKKGALCAAFAAAVIGVAVAAPAIAGSIIGVAGIVGLVAYGISKQGAPDTNDPKTKKALEGLSSLPTILGG